MFNFEKKIKDHNIMTFFSNSNIETFSTKFQFPFVMLHDKTSNFSYSYTKDNLKKLFNNFSDFKDCFINQNIYIKDEKALFNFFINNENIDISIIAYFTELIRNSFTKDREIIVNYEEEYKKNLCFCIRQNDYTSNNLNDLISKVENNIIDIFEDTYPNADFDILLTMDYEKPELLSNSKVYNGI